MPRSGPLTPDHRPYDGQTRAAPAGLQAPVPARALLRNRCNLEEVAAPVMQTRTSGVHTSPDQVGVFPCHTVRVHQLTLCSLWLEIKPNMNLT